MIEIGQHIIHKIHGWVGVVRSISEEEDNIEVLVQWAGDNAREWLDIDDIEELD